MMKHTVFPVVLIGLLTSSTMATPSVVVTAEEYRLVCGYEEALKEPAMQKIHSDKAKLKKIAAKAKVKPAKMEAALQKSSKYP
jgi:hypothetical protein